MDILTLSDMMCDIQDHVGHCIKVLAYDRCGHKTALTIELFNVSSVIGKYRLYCCVYPKHVGMVKYYLKKQEMLMNKSYLRSIEHR